MSSNNPYSYSLNIDETFPEKPLFKTSIKSALTLGLSLIICTSLTLLYLSNNQRYEVLSASEKSALLFDHKKNVLFNCHEGGCKVIWHPALEEGLLSTLGLQEQPFSLSSYAPSATLKEEQLAHDLKGEAKQSSPIQKPQVITKEASSPQKAPLRFDEKTKEAIPEKLYGREVTAAQRTTERETESTRQIGARNREDQRQSTLTQSLDRPLRQERIQEQTKQPKESVRQPQQETRRETRASKQDREDVAFQRQNSRSNANERFSSSMERNSFQDETPQEPLFDSEDNSLEG
jgi:hypothetical protein